MPNASFHFRRRLHKSITPLSLLIHPYPFQAPPTPTHWPPPHPPPRKGEIPSPRQRSNPATTSYPAESLPPRKVPTIVTGTKRRRPDRVKWSGGRGRRKTLKKRRDGWITLEFPSNRANPCFVTERDEPMRGIHGAGPNSNCIRLHG